MKRKKLILLLVAISITALFLCCDRIENLSEKKTEALYSELKKDIQVGGLWNLEQAYFHQEKDLPDNFSFLRSSVETVFENEDLISGTYGAWYGSESSCKVLRLVCQTPFYNGEQNYIIDELIISKYYDHEKYKFELNYHAEEEEAQSHYIEVFFQ